MPINMTPLGRSLLESIGETKPSKVTPLGKDLLESVGESPDSLPFESTPAEVPVKTAGQTVIMPKATALQSALNSPIVDTITGGMSLPEAEKNAARIVSGVRSLPSRIVESGKELDGLPGQDMKRLFSTLIAPVPEVPVKPIFTPLENTASVASDALNTVFAPAIAGMRGIASGLVPETGKTRLQSIVKDIVAPPEPGIYGERLREQMPTPKTEAEATGQALQSGLKGAAIEIMGLSPKGVFNYLKRLPVEASVAGQKEVLSQIEEYLPKLKSQLKKSRPDLPSDVIDNLTAEQVIQGAQTNPTLGDFINKVTTNQAKKLYTAQPELPAPKPEELKPLIASLPKDLQPKDNLARDAEGKPISVNIQPTPTMPTREIVQPSATDEAVFPTGSEKLNDLGKMNVDNIKASPVANVINSKGNLELWHGTSKKNIKAIRQSKSIKNFGWFAADKETALKFARQAGGSPDVVKVEVSPNDVVFNGNYFTSQKEEIPFVEATEQQVDNVVSPELMQKGISEEAKDHPEIAAKHTELLPTIVKDELKIDKSAYGKPPQEPPKPPAVATGMPEEPVDPIKKAVDEVRQASQGEKGFSTDVNKLLISPKSIAQVEQILSKELPAGQVRRIINSNVGIRRKAPEAALLKRELQQEAVASREGFRAGVKEATVKVGEAEKSKRVAAIASLKNLFSNEMSEAERSWQMEGLKQDILAREKVKVKKAVADYVEDKLPKEERGRYVQSIARAKTRAEMSEIFRRVDKAARDYERKSLVQDIRNSVAKVLKKSSTIAVEYRSKIADLLKDVDLKKRRPETLDEWRKTKEFIEREKAAGKDVFMPDYVLEHIDILRKRKLGDVSTEELKEILGKMDRLVKAGEVKLSARNAIYEFEKESTRNELINSVVPIEQHPMITKDLEPLSASDKFKNVVRKALSVNRDAWLSVTPMDTVMDIADGGASKFDGPHSMLKKKIDLSFQKYLVMSSDLSSKIIQTAREKKLDENNFKRIGIVSARLQDGGREKLRARGLTDKEIDSVSLTPEEESLRLSMRKQLDAIRERIEETMRDVWNKPLGTVKEYFPFITDFEKASEQHISERFGTTQVKAKTKKTEMGFTEERVGGKQPIEIDAMKVYLKHMDNVSYLINMSRDIKMAFEIFNSKEYHKAAGDVIQQNMMDWIDLIARKGGIAGEHRIVALDVLRRNFGLAQLGLSIPSALIQPTAIFDAGMVIGPKAFEGLYKVIADKDARKFVLDNMPEVKNRVGDDPAFVDYGGKLVEKLQKGGYFAIRFLDSVTATGAAYGAYLKKLSDLGLELDLSKPNAEAISYAQEVVRRTQSSGSFKDTPLALSRGKMTGNRSIDRAFWQFFSYQLTRFSNIKDNMLIGKLMGGRKEEKERDIKGAALVATMLAAALITESKVRRSIKDVRKELFHIKEKERTTLGEDVVMNFITGIPFIAQGVSMAMYDSDVFPSISGVKDVFQAPAKIALAKKPESRSKAVVDMLAGIGRVTGIPGTSEVQREARAAVNSGTKENIANIYREAFRTGSASKKDEADALAKKNGLIISRMEDDAQEYVDKELVDMYIQAVNNDSSSDYRKFKDACEKAGLTEEYINYLEDRGEKRIAQKETREAEDYKLLQEQNAK